MKVGLKFRFSKKLLLVLMGSVVLVGGGSGAAAVFIGTDDILDPSHSSVNGLSCRVVNTIKINRDQRLWVRKYVVSDQASDKPADGMARLRTALRVARAVQQKEKADLVQVAMLDTAGPTERAGMRGRAIGAQVIYMPDPGKAPEGVDAQTYSAYYHQGGAAPDGRYYGLRIDPPLEEVEALTARLTDAADCVDPLAVTPAAAASDDDGHGKTSGHGEQPAEDGHAALAGEHGDEAATEEGGGLIASISGMIFGSEPAVATETDSTETDPVEIDSAETNSAERGAAEGEVSPGESAKGEAAKEEAIKEEGGIFASLKSMVFGGGGDKAEGEDDAIQSSDPAPDPAHEEAEADGDVSDADAAGAAWLAKMRGE